MEHKTELDQIFAKEHKIEIFSIFKGGRHFPQAMSPREVQF